MAEESKDKKGKGSGVAHLLPMINTVSILIGIVAGLMHMREISHHAEDIASFLKISSIGYLEQLTEESEAVQADLSTFFPEITSKNEEVRRRIEGGEPGHLIFHSDSMREFRNVCNFWERTAVFVELGYFEFDVVYHLKPFPRRFWSETGEIRDLIGRHWYGKDEPLTNFLTGMKRLEKTYREEDAKVVSTATP